MTRFVKFITAICVLTVLQMPAMATGPRVTPALFDSDAHEIYALDFPPFISTELAESGPIPDIVSQALSTPEHDVLINAQPLQRMVKYYLLEESGVASVGRYLDLSSAHSNTLVKIPVLVTSESYYYYRPNQKHGITWDGALKSLRDYRYGAHTGEPVEQLEKVGIAVTKGRSVPLLKKLKKGDVDFVSFPDLAAGWLFQRYFRGDESSFVRLGTARHESVVYVTFNLKHPQGEILANKFRNNLVKMLDDGRYGEIMSKHLGNSDHISAHSKRLRKELE